MNKSLKIGFSVNFKKAKLPSKKKLIGEYSILEPINVNKHLKDLFNSFSLDKTKKLWAYMPVGPFKNISSLTTIDIPNQPNSIKGETLRKKLKKFPNIQFKKSITEAINSCPVSENDIILITGSLYLAGEVLNLN